MSRLTVAPIVEGHGEFEATRELLQRIWIELLLGEHIEVLRPIRQSRGKLLKQEHLVKAVNLAALKLAQAPPPHLILLLLDSEGVCPKFEAPVLLIQAKGARADFDIACVLAHPMYETWFVAAAESLHAYFSLRPNDDTRDPEGAQLGKGWIKERMRSYSETVDQPRLTASRDLRACRGNAPSFDKLCRELERRLSPPSPPPPPAPSAPPPAGAPPGTA